MANDPRVFFGILVFAQEFLCTGKGYFIDIFLNLLLGHSNPLVNDMELLTFLVGLDLNNGLSVFYLGFTNGNKVLEFQGSIRCIRNQFPEKYLVITV